MYNIRALLVNIALCFSLNLKSNRDYGHVHKLGLTRP